ncbi:hypothetical protein [Roseococcus sp. YIM B11640]|uniref:hypothetical protein n=1 Tax=Roseococcus sp. YIM B11640 TaxID=3133973 RepID=UPI003C7B4CD8
MSDRTQPSASRDEDVREEAGVIAGRLREGAAEAADAVKDGTGKLAEKAKAEGSELLGQAQARAEDLAEEGKAAGAEQASGLARAIRHAAEDLEDSSPDIARHVRAAADSLNGISDALRQRSVGELFDEVTDFARRQPALFFGAAAIAGFALARFARSSAGGGKRAASSDRPAGSAPGWIRSDGDAAPRPATMAAASLGGAAAHRDGDAEPGQMPAAPGGAARVPAPTGAEGRPGAIPNEKSESPL